MYTKSEYISVGEYNVISEHEAEAFSIQQVSRCNMGRNFSTMCQVSAWCTAHYTILHNLNNLVVYQFMLKGGVCQGNMGRENVETNQWLCNVPLTKWTRQKMKRTMGIMG